MTARIRGDEVCRGAAAPGDLWVFGYGSLMWRPGFPYVEAKHARLAGYRRSFCIYSVHHRGTLRRPGLVLGLDRGGACEGILYRVAEPDVKAALAYLWTREQPTAVYREAFVPVTPLRGSCRREVRALAYLVERAHPTYAGRLPLPRQAELIAASQGSSGTNLEYLVNTLTHLRDLGIRDRPLERVLTVIGGLAGRRRDTGQPRRFDVAKHHPRRPKFRAGDLASFGYRAAISRASQA